MPVYVYVTAPRDGSPGATFEVQQSMHEPPLTVHPLTGDPVSRVIQPPNLCTQYTPGKTARQLDDKNVQRKGFTKYVRDKQTGTYHKTVGAHPGAPETLRPD